MSAGNEKSVLPELTLIKGIRRACESYEKSGLKADLGVDAADLIPSVNLLLERGFFLEDISGVDVEEGIMLAYHFDHYDGPRRVVLRLTVPHTAKKAPSIAAIYSGADWHERECFDFFGVEFQNHPNLKPLLLPDDMKLRPLLKEKGRKSIYALLPLMQVMETGGEPESRELGKQAKDPSSSEGRSGE